VTVPPADLETPCLVLDRPRLERNCARMKAKMAGLGLALRPHIKTAKCAEVAELACDDDRRLTVSTVAEARFFAERGFTDIVYAVGLIPAKVGPLKAVVEASGARVAGIVDTTDAAEAVAAAATALDFMLPLYIEIDTGDGRGGVLPDAPELEAIATILAKRDGVSLAGVLTHAGQSYRCHSIDEVRAVAEDERNGLTAAATQLRGAGFDCPEVSAGSTPTATHAESGDGLTEMRPGVYVFGDLDQMALGSCVYDDIAVTVLASVIGHNHQQGHILIDAGGLALSKDISAGDFLDRVGYGWLADPDTDGGAPIDDLYVAGVSQEHGVVRTRDGGPVDFDRYPVGARLRVIPNHVCMTAAAYDRYHVLAGNSVETWSRAVGWY
jgi:D-serine deaminase-like pyridoxal phosphate-dependent protein